MSSFWMVPTKLPEGLEYSGMTRAKARVKQVNPCILPHLKQGLLQRVSYANSSNRVLRDQVVEPGRG